MPYKNLREQSGVVQKFTGRLSAEEYLASVVEIVNDTNFELIRYVIADFSEVTETDLSKKEVTQVAALSKGAMFTNNGIKIAVVVIDPTLMDLAKAYKSERLASYPTEIFSTVEQARKWLLPSL